MATADSAVSFDSKVDYFKYSWLLPIALISNGVCGRRLDDDSCEGEKGKQGHDETRRMHSGKPYKNLPFSGESHNLEADPSNESLITTVLKDMLEFGTCICGTEDGCVQNDLLIEPEDVRQAEIKAKEYVASKPNKNIRRPRRSRKTSYDSLFDFSKKNSAGPDLNTEYLPTGLRRGVSVQKEQAGAKRSPQSRPFDDIFEFSDIDESEESKDEDDFSAPLPSLDFIMMEDFDLTPTSFYGTKKLKFRAGSPVSFPSIAEESKEDIFSGLSDHTPSDYVVAGDWVDHIRWRQNVSEDLD